jgi:hypothetical protein
MHFFGSFIQCAVRLFHACPSPANPHTLGHQEAFLTLGELPCCISSLNLLNLEILPPSPVSWSIRFS